jgi:hypothetical protein
VKDLSLLPSSLQNLSRRHSLSICEVSEKIRSQLTQEWRQEGDGIKKLETLSLKLEEVKHIRSVLSKAKIEVNKINDLVDLNLFTPFQELPLDDDLHQAAEQGRVCFLCLKTKFWLFNRGVHCSICCHLVCGKCTHAMRIPADHATATPVLLLSPSQTSPPPHPDSSLSQLEVSNLSSTSNCQPCQTTFFNFKYFFL